MTLEIAVATLVALGYALGAFADEKRERDARLSRRPALGAKGGRPPLPSSP